MNPATLIQELYNYCNGPGEAICDPACGTAGFRHSSRRARAAGALCGIPCYHGKN